MSYFSNTNRGNMPSARRLIKATLGSIAIAGIILLTAILPAEFGIDPTGLGRITGLDQLGPASNEKPIPVQQEPSESDVYANGPVWKGEAAPRSDRIKIPLLPGQGAEIKSRMLPGDNFVFSWRVEGGVVSFDMHGERPNSGGAFISYWLGDNQSEASGSFFAPFEGTHGWYWENTGSEPVTVILKTDGFYNDLYMP